MRLASDQTNSEACKRAGEVARGVLGVPFRGRGPSPRLAPRTRAENRSAQGRGCQAPNAADDGRVAAISGGGPRKGTPNTPEATDQIAPTVAGRRAIYEMRSSRLPGRPQLAVPVDPPGPGDE